jgi:hypothetical protein
MIVLAIATLYFYPPESLDPLIPQIVPKPLSNSTSLRTLSLSSTSP